MYYNITYVELEERFNKTAVNLYKAVNIYSSFSEEIKQQVVKYKNGAKNKAWMITRGNIKYIVDKGFI